MGEQTTSGPDLTQGFDAAALADGKILLGHAEGEAVLVTRRGDEVFAVGATCTHWAGPLAEGVVIGDTIHCPLHHACFSLRTGQPLQPPARDPIPCWQVEPRGEKLYVVGKWAPPARVVIVGGGPAALHTAETLRAEGYAGTITLLSASMSPPVDLPNLSKDYLLGDVPDEWIPLRPPEFFTEHNVELVLNARVTHIDAKAKTISTADGRTFAYDALVLATGADAIRLSIPGADLPHVHTLRTFAEAQAIMHAAKTAKRAVVMGASFIGLEVAASLRKRGLDVTVVAPDARPLERILGPALGDFFRALHEAHGVVFKLGTTATAMEPDAVVTAAGDRLPADLVVAGIGVRPPLAVAETAGVAIDRGIVVDAFLQTNVRGIFAAGDCARFPDPRSGAPIRVEHWVVAQQMGKAVARNILGRRERFAVVPFFWTRQHDVSIHYVGHAEAWDEIVIDGDLAKHDARIEYKKSGAVLAVATIGRRAEAIQTQAAMERALHA